MERSYVYATLFLFLCFYNVKSERYNSFNSVQSSQSKPSELSDTFSEEIVNSDSYFEDEIQHAGKLRFKCI